MKLTLHFTGGPTQPFDEEVEAVPGTWEGVDCYRLKSHATFAPLAPGDLVQAKDGVICEVLHLDQLWTVEATLHLPAGTTRRTRPSDHPAMRAVVKVEREWSRAAWVTRNTPFSFLVSAQTRDWLEVNVEHHPYVEHVALVRTPDMTANLRHWLTRPSF